MGEVDFGRFCIFQDFFMNSLKITDEELFQTTLVTGLPYLIFCLFPGHRFAYGIWALVFLYTTLLYSYTFFAFVLSPDMPALPAYTLEVLFNAFRTPASILVIWVHTGAQDLVTMLTVFMLNRFMVGIPHFFMVFVIPTIWMVGPMGALIYLVVAGVCALLGWRTAPRNIHQELFHDLDYAPLLKQ